MTIFLSVSAAEFGSISIPACGEVPVLFFANGMIYQNVRSLDNRYTVPPIVVSNWADQFQSCGTIYVESISPGIFRHRVNNDHIGAAKQVKNNGVARLLCTPILSS